MKRRSLVLALSIALGACTVGPDYRRPELAVPAHWTAINAPASQVDANRWWQQFHDPVLNRLVSDALIANLDVQQAALRVKDARAQRWATLALGLPSVSAKSNASRRFNNSASAAQTNGSSAAGGGFGIGNQTINIFQMGFDAQWELDFFGGVRRALEAADATVESEQENSHAVVVSLLGDVAANYISLRANQQLIALTHQHIAAQQATVELTQIRQQAGFTTELEVAQAQAQLANLTAALPSYETAAALAIHALGILLGREPNALQGRLTAIGAIPQLPLTAVAELPSTLLQRRPDIRQAERQLAAATANIGVATAELYPKVNLAAFLGLQNMRITDFTPIGKSWSTAASLSMPLFNWGKINANITSKKAQAEQAQLAYQATILSAFQEVEDALVAYSNGYRRLASLNQAVAANQVAVQLANERYSKGLTLFLDVLQSQQALYQSQREQTDSLAQVAKDLVALYKALGGGWQAATVIEPNLSNMGNIYHFSVE